MSKFKGPHNNTHPGAISSNVSVFWSQRRSWHGDEVVMSVRTAGRPQGNVELKIVPKGGADPLDTVAGQKVAASKLDHTYKIDWKGKPFANKREFVIKAKIDEKEKLTAESEPLIVDLEPPIFSA